MAPDIWGHFQVTAFFNYLFLSELRRFPSREHLFQTDKNKLHLGKIVQYYSVWYWKIVGKAREILDLSFCPCCWQQETKCQHFEVWKKNRTEPAFTDVLWGYIHYLITLADPMGRGAPETPGLISFIFMPFSAKFCQIIGFCPNWGVGSLCLNHKISSFGVVSSLSFNWPVRLVLRDFYPLRSKRTLTTATQMILVLYINTPSLFKRVWLSFVNWFLCFRNLENAAHFLHSSILQHLQKFIGWTWFKACKTVLLSNSALISLNFYRPQRSCGKVMFLHLSVFLFTGGGGSLSRRGSLSRGDSVRETPPRYSNMRAVRILLECIIFQKLFLHCECIRKEFLDNFLKLFLSNLI